MQAERQGGFGKTNTTTEEAFQCVPECPICLDILGSAGGPVTLPCGEQRTSHRQS